MFRGLLYLLLILFLVRAVYRLMRGIAQGTRDTGAAQGSSRPASPSAVKMAQDPVCGTYVVPGKAFQLTRGREILYFCSETCREKYALQG